MSKIHTRNGQRFNVYASGVVDGVRYPHFLDPKTQKALGITEVAEPKPPKAYDPDTHHRQELDAAPWVVYSKLDPAEATGRRWEKLRMIREDLVDNGGVLVAGKWFHTDPRSCRQRIERLLVVDMLPAGLKWKTMDGSFVELTAQLLREVVAAQIAREHEIFNLAEAKAADQSPIGEGWPARFERPMPGEPARGRRPA